MSLAWNILAVSATGTSHQRGNKPCQDFCLSSILPGGMLVSAVADGAGSASHAEIGAETACRALIAFLEKSLPPVVAALGKYVG